MKLRFPSKYVFHLKIGGNFMEYKQNKSFFRLDEIDWAMEEY